MNIPEVPDLPYIAYIAYMAYDEEVFKNAFILPIFLTEVIEADRRKIFKGKLNGEPIEGDYCDIYLTESGARAHLIGICHELLNETTERLDKIYKSRENLIASKYHLETKLQEIWADETQETIE
jgi:hypothetical protein